MRLKQKNEDELGMGDSRQIKIPCSQNAEVLCGYFYFNYAGTYMLYTYNM